MCNATVDYPALGYDAVLGWVQLVRSDDNESHGAAFEVDPLDFLGDVPHPFCWIGQNPHLFDAPSRSPRRDLDWLAHSFLCVPDARSDPGLEFHALLGFSWGFAVRGEEILLVPPTRLGPRGVERPRGRAREAVPGVAVRRRVPQFLSRGPGASRARLCQPEGLVQRLLGMTNSVPEDLLSMGEWRTTSGREAADSAGAELVDVLFRRHYTPRCSASALLMLQGQREARETPFRTPSWPCTVVSRYCATRRPPRRTCAPRC